MFSSLARGSGLLTQGNPYVDSILGGKCLTYDQSGLGIGDVLSRPDSELEAMAAAGMDEVIAHHTWDSRIAELVGFMAGLDEKFGRPPAEAALSRSGKISIGKIKHRPVRQALRRLMSFGARRPG